MLGAIIGDMVGSIYEFDPIKKKEFDIFDKRMAMTDDSILTIAIALVLMKHYPLSYDRASLDEIEKEISYSFVEMWKNNPYAGWGGRFSDWCYKIAHGGKIEPYHSYGNGSAMRVSSVAWVAKTEEELRKLSKAVTEVTHNSFEGEKGAEAVAMAIFMALHGASKEEIGERMIKDYYPEIKDYDFDDLVKNYRFSEICQESVPQAIYCFLISDSLEDAVRNCVGIGGDCDTTGAMAGAIAEAYYSKDKMGEFEKKYFDTMVHPKAKEVVINFHKTIGSHKFDEYLK